jgi:hypothetical protein
MKALAALRTDRLAGLAAALGCDRRRVRSRGPQPGCGDCGSPSQAFAEYDAKDAKGGSHHNRSANLKPNIYYKAQDFAPGIAHADFSFDEPARGRVEDLACDW